MIVRMCMTQNAQTISPDALVTQAARVMARRRIRRLPVVRGALNPRLIGIISTHDILHAFPSDVNPFCVSDSRLDTHTLAVSEIMSRRVWTTHPETPIEEAARLLRERKVGALPVMRDSRLVGIITESDIFRVLAAMLAPDERGLRITCDAPNREELVLFVADAARRHGLGVASIITYAWEDRPMAVIRVVGTDGEAFVDEVCDSGYKVLSVLATDADPIQKVIG